MWIFILFCSKILFREQFIWRKYHSPRKSMFVWPLAFFSFIFPFQDRVWPFLSTSPWANTISFQSLDPKLKFLGFLSKKEMHILCLKKLRADRLPLCIGVELCHLKLTNLGHVADRNKTCVYFFLQALYEKRACKANKHCKWYFRDKVLACLGKKEFSSTIKNYSKGPTELSGKPTLRDRASIKTQAFIILKPVLFPLNCVGPSCTDFLWLQIHVL